MKKAKLLGGGPLLAFRGHNNETKEDWGEKGRATIIVITPRQL